MNGVRTFPDAAAAAEACAQAILALLDAVIEERPATLALSGGSTPKLMFESMARRPFNWSRVHLFWVDERAVPPDDPQSNFGLARQHLIEPAGIPAGNVHRVLGELHPEEAARRYVLEIEDYFELLSGELPRFDVVHQGMGPDAHTASLFPGEPLIEDREGIAAAVYVSKMAQWRITLLPGVLLSAHHTFVLAAGADKAEAVQEVFEAPLDALRYPAQLVARGGRDVTWFLDSAAGSQIRI